MSYFYSWLLSDLKSVGIYLEYLKLKQASQNLIKAWLTVGWNVACLQMSSGLLWWTVWGKVHEDSQHGWQRYRFDTKYHKELRNRSPEKMSFAFIRMQNPELGISQHGPNLLGPYAYSVIVRWIWELSYENTAFPPLVSWYGVGSGDSSLTVSLPQYLPCAHGSRSHTSRHDQWRVELDCCRSDTLAGVSKWHCLSNRSQSVEEAGGGCEWLYSDSCAPRAWESNRLIILILGLGKLL